MKKWMVLMWLGGCGRAPVETLRIAAQTFAAVDATQVKSYELWVLAQVGRDSNPIQCGDLISKKITPASDNVLKVLSPIDGDFGSSSLSVKNVPNGVQDRVFYIDLYSQPGQIGPIVGSGCTASVTIAGGKTTQLEIDISAPTLPASP